MNSIIKFIAIALILTISNLSSASGQDGGKAGTEMVHNEPQNQLEELIKKVETLNNSFVNSYQELNNKLNAGFSHMGKQIDLTQGNLRELAVEFDEYKNDISPLLSGKHSTDWTQVGMFWSSMILVFVTVMATYINYRIFRLQTDPEVIVYATPDPSRPSIVNLIIENIGKGVAQNIKFKSDKPIPCRAFGIGDNAAVPQNMKSGPLITGVPEMGPGSKRIITWGQYHGLFKGLGDDIVAIKANYSARKVFLKTPMFSSTFFLDIKSFEGTDASDQNWAKKSAESLEKIAKSFKEIESKNG